MKSNRAGSMVCGTSLTVFYPKSCLFASVCGSVENFVEKVETQNDSPLFYGVYNRLASRSECCGQGDRVADPTAAGGRWGRSPHVSALPKRSATLVSPPLHKITPSVQVLFSSRLAEISKAAVPKHGGWGSGLIYAAGVSVFSSAEGSSSVAAGTMISLISV